MQSIGTTAAARNDLHRQIEAILDPIRRDRSLSDAERARRITDVVAAANARTLARSVERKAALVH